MNIRNLSIKLRNISQDGLSILGDHLCKTIELKFNNVEPSTLYTATSELIKFMYLGSQKEGALFFPGNKLIDDIWHALILETDEYKKLCSRLNDGCFLNHTGIKFKDYRNKNGLEKITEEQFSWLASYQYNFGEISEEAFKLLPLAQHLSKTLRMNLLEINSFSKQLIKQSNINKSEFNLVSFLKENVDKNRNKIDASKFHLLPFPSEIINNKGTHLTNEELEQVFYYSPALAFTIWQHFAATEKIKQSFEWENNSNKFVSEIKK